MSSVLYGLNNTTNLSDDIILLGESEANHDQNVMHTLKRLESRGITMRFNKCQFKVKELNFF
jgi:hypothetical protein